MKDNDFLERNWQNFC